MIPATPFKNKSRGMNFHAPAFDIFQGLFFRAYISN